MAFNIVIDKSNTPETIEKLSKALEDNPFAHLKLQKVSEAPLVETATGKEVYRVFVLEMESDLPGFMVRPMLKHLGFTQDPNDQNTFMM